MQQRKLLEERANGATALDSKTSDLETYFHLAQEESNTAQRDSILFRLPYSGEIGSSPGISIIIQ